MDGILPEGGGPARKGGAPAVPAGLLLAAGAGTRIGMPKAILSWADGLLIDGGLRLLRDSGCAPIRTVLGAEADRVMAVSGLSDDDVTVAQRWAEGQSHSLRAGLDWAESIAAPAVVIALVDQPLVTAAAIQRLIGAWRGGAVAAVATYGGRWRTPVLLDASVRDDVQRDLHGDRGAGPWLRAHPTAVTPVEVGDISDDVDIDTPEDLQRVRSRLPGH